MSGKKKDKPAVDDQSQSYEPANPGYTLAQLQDLSSFFFKLGENKTAKRLAVLAACGAILGGLHVLWQAFIWVYGRMH